MGMSLRKKALSGRFRWLLETMLRKQGIDVQALDDALDYWENKAAIEAKYRTMLVLALSKLEAIE
jgi:hypothetical protein